jgi:hypothetical protein
MKRTRVPFLYARIENTPRDRETGATYQRETIKNEGQ